MKSIHPIAKCYPSLSKKDFDQLKNSIQKLGLLNPIVLLHDQILDGVHRSLACSELGIEPQYINPKIDDPFEYVIAQNERRRQLTFNELTIVAEKMAGLKLGSNRFQGKIDASNDASTNQIPDPRAVTKTDVAKRLGISRPTIDRLRYARKHGIEELRQAVEGDKITITKAWTIAHLDKRKQVNALKEVLAGKKISPANHKQRLQRVVSPKTKEIRHLIREAESPPLSDRCKRTWHTLCASEFLFYRTKEEKLTLFQYLIACSSKAIELIDEINNPEELYDLST